MSRFALFLVCLFVSLTGAPGLPQAQSTVAAQPSADNGAVVIMYHRFGEGDYPSTNVTLEQFEAHLAELRTGPYNVLPLPEVVAALREGRTLPDRSVAITVDDAYLSVYTEAWPRLRDAGFPFTLFLATDPVDQETPRFMTWDQVREIAASDLVTLGHHTASHAHMVDLSAEQNRQEIERATARFVREVGDRPDLFAYPYGEHSLEVRDLVMEFGFEAAFGQQSGAISRLLHPFELPRFTFNETYSTIDRFRLVVNSLPLPVTDLTPADTRIDETANPPLYGFTVAGDVGPLASLNCFASRGNTATVERLGQRVEVRLSAALEVGRSRINCTMPGPEGRWRWFGRQLYLPRR